jgi:hypothetical protein
MRPIYKLVAPPSEKRNIPQLLSNPRVSSDHVTLREAVTALKRQDATKAMWENSPLDFANAMIPWATADTANWPVVSARAATREAFRFLDQHLNRVSWYELCHTNASPLAGEFLERHLGYITWSGICANPAPWATRLLAKYPHFVTLSMARNTSRAVLDELRSHPPLTATHSDKVFTALMWNDSPDALVLACDLFPDRVTRQMLAHVMERTGIYPSEIMELMQGDKCVQVGEDGVNNRALAVAEAKAKAWSPLHPAWRCDPSVGRSYTLEPWADPAIFKLDYAKMQVAMQPLREEIARHVMHPSRVHLLAGLGLV